VAPTAGGQGAGRDGAAACIPAYSDRFAPVIGQLREALAAVCRIVGVMQPPAAAEVAWRPLDPGRDALLLALDGELSRAELVGDDEVQQFLAGGDPEQDDGPED